MYSNLIASIIEVAGGQPFDAWKVNQQLKTGKFDYRTLWRASGVSSIHRMFFYMPSIYLSNYYLENNPYRLLLVPAIVTPHVSYFEFIKTQKQLEQFKTHCVVPNTMMITYARESCFIVGLTYLTPFMRDTFGFSELTTSISSSIIAQTASQPFDTIKTIQERSAGKMSVSQVYQTIPIRQLWSGVLSRILRGIWTFYCMNYIVNWF